MKTDSTVTVNMSKSCIARVITSANSNVQLVKTNYGAKSLPQKYKIAVKSVQTKFPNNILPSEPQTQLRQCNAISKLTLADSKWTTSNVAETRNQSRAATKHWR